MPTISGAKGGITVRDLLQIGPAVFRLWMEDKNVAKVYEIIRLLKKRRDAGEITEKEFSDEKNKLKALLIYVTYMAYFKNDIRKNENAIPTGLYIMDYDHEPEPEAFYNTLIKGREGELAIALVHITPSGEGLRIVACVPTGMTITEAQAWMGGQLGRMDYDKAVHDLARASFMFRGAGDTREN